MANWIDVSSVAPRIAYTATASQTLFAVPFVFFENADLLVYQNDVLLTLDTDYTVSGAEDETGGAVVLLTGATVGNAIMITRDVAIVQSSHIPPSGPLDVPAINIQFSKLIAIDQQLDDRIDRSVHLADSDVTASMEVPTVTTRLGKLWSWDAATGDLAATTHTAAEFDSVVTGALNVNAGFANVTIIGTLAALKALTPIAGAFVYVQGRLADGDGGQGIFAWKSGNFSTQVAIDTNSGVYAKANGTAASSGCWVRQFDGVTLYSKWFGTLTDGSDNSAKITTALATMASPNVNYAPTLRIEPGVKFSRISLTFSKRGFIEYFSDDDTRQNPYTSRVTSEYVRFAFNANSGGIVNEFVFDGAYGPALIVNNDKDAPGHDAYLGANHTASVQGRVPGTYYTTAGTGSPVDVSSKTYFGMEDERWSSFYIINESYGTATKSPYDGVKMHAYRRRQVITVDSTAGFTSFVGAMIQGLTSLAFGYFVSKTATTVTIDWQYSQFQLGEQLYDFSTGARPVVASYTSAATVGQHMWFGQSNGAISFGVPPGYAITDYTFGGRVLFHPTVNFGQINTETVTAPAAVFCADIVSAPTIGQQIVLNVDSRLVSVSGTAASTGSNATGWVGAVGAACSFNNSASASAPAGSFNVASVIRNSTGLYTINFTTPLLNANYAVSIAAANKADFPRVNNTLVGSCSIQNWNSVGTATDLAGLVYISIIGGK